MSKPIFTMEDILDVLDKDPNTVTYHTFIRRYAKGLITRTQLSRLVNRQFLISAFNQFSNRPIEMLNAYDEFVKNPGTGILNELQDTKPAEIQKVFANDQIADDKVEKNAEPLTLVENVIELRNVFTGETAEIRLV